jgi:enoyl-CoA hydratase/carnithine racemase
MPLATQTEGPVLFERLTDHIGLATLNRPEKRNAVNPELALALERIVEGAESDLEIRVMILTSCDGRVFCAGADLGAVAAGKAEGLETSRGGFGGFVYATRVKPWIAAVEGIAVAGGMELALACDMIVASENARFGLPEVKRGLMAAAGGIHRIASALPRNVANELLATGEPMDGTAAFGWGLANRLTAPGQTLAEARKLAESIAENSPLAVQRTLCAGRESLGQPDGAGRALVARHLNALRRTEDFREGPRAYVEKRAPVWTGR